VPLTYNSATLKWEVLITRSLLATIPDASLTYGSSIVCDLYVSDILGNDNTGSEIRIFTDFVDEIIPDILSIEINGNVVDEENKATIEPNQYTSIEVAFDDLGKNSSRIKSAIVYYTTGSASGEYTSWNSFDLNEMTGYRLYQTFPNDQVGFVGFAPNTVITVVVVITDNDGNVVESEQITITVIGEEPAMVMASQILMSVAGAIVVGSIIYRFLRRKKVKVIDRG
jgi:hypothetical protein